MRRARRPPDILPPQVRTLLERVPHTPLLEPLTFIVRLGWLFYKELHDDKAFVRAAGMAYATLMALVPLLVLVFGVLGSLGVLQEPAEQEAVYDALFGTFFGDVDEIRAALTPFLSNIDFRALGAVSTGALLVVAARLFLMVERAYSDIFEVRVSRPMAQRILNFYFAITAVPLVLVLSIEGAWRYGLGDYQPPFVALLQLLLLVLALKFFPCTHVRWAPALLGAGTSWALLELGSRGFTLFIAWSYADPEYPLRAFYGSLILLPIFLLWLYTLWVIVLLGVEVAHVAQNYGTLLEAEMEAAERARGLRCASLANAAELLARVARSFELGEGAVDAPGLAEQTGLSVRNVTAIADALVEAELLLVSEAGWLLSRPADTLTLAEVEARWRDQTRLYGGDEAVSGELQGALELQGTLADAVERWFPVPLRMTGP